MPTNLIQNGGHQQYESNVTLKEKTFLIQALISRNVEKDVMNKLGKIYIDTILKQSCICDDCILHAYNRVDFKVYSHNIQY